MVLRKYVRAVPPPLSVRFMLQGLCNTETMRNSVRYAIIIAKIFTGSRWTKRVFLKRTVVILAIMLTVCPTVALTSCGQKKPTATGSVGNERRVFISGSASVMPLLKTLSGEFSRKERDIEIIFLPDSHSDAGIAGTTEEKYDIGAISRERLPEERESPLRYLHLARDGMVFVTNPDLKISDLSSGQVRDIYSGKVDNWAAMGGPNAKIAVIDRPEHTSAKLALRKTILGEHLSVTSTAITVERPWQVTDSVQLIPYSIGYTSLGEIVSENPPVNVIALDGVSPVPANLKDGVYKFLRPFGLVLGPNPKASTMRFVNFVFSDAGSKIIRNSGYIPQRYEIIIGIVPEQDLMVQNQRYQPLADYLAHKLGERFSVKLKLFSTYIDVCRSLADGTINAAFLGSLAYVTVRDYVDVIARPDYQGVSTYRGVLFVRSDSGINGLEQMRGKRLVMGGRTTTAGYVFPLYYFKEHGIPDYTKYFSDAFFVGTHEDAMLAVLHKKADVGAAKDLIFNMIAAENPMLKSSLKILAESPAVPSNAFAVRKKLNLPCFDCHQTMIHISAAEGGTPPKIDIEATIRNYLLSMPQDPEGRVALEAIGNAVGFIPTTDSDYSELYKMLDKIGAKPGDPLKRPEEKSIE